MAQRFVYKVIDKAPYVEIKPIEFLWEKGTNIVMRKRSSINLHNTIKQNGIADNVLECSRAGSNSLGIQLSAFNLPYYEDTTMTVENVYQGSKVFVNPFNGEEEWLEELFYVDSKKAKADPRLKDTTHFLKKFRLHSGEEFEVVDKTGLKVLERYHFYNYIYIKSLVAYIESADNSEEVKNYILQYDAFTDVMLKWYNGAITSCQAMATAMYVGMLKSGVIDKYMGSFKDFMLLYK